MNRARLRLAVALAVAVTALAVMFSNSGPASAHFVTSHLTLSVSDSSLAPGQTAHFSGTLNTDGHHACEANRLIRLFRAGHTASVKKTHTNGSGDYSFNFKPHPRQGSWYTKVGGFTAGHNSYGYVTHRCSRARSNTVSTTKA